MALRDRLGSERKREVVIGCPECKQAFILKVGEALGVSAWDAGGCDTCGPDVEYTVTITCPHCKHVLLRDGSE